ncbi:unnamed protein product [Musa textilis]
MPLWEVCPRRRSLAALVSATSIAGERCPRSRAGAPPDVAVGGLPVGALPLRGSARSGPTPLCGRRPPLREGANGQCCPLRESPTLRPCGWAQCLRADRPPVQAACSRCLPMARSTPIDYIQTASGSQGYKKPLAILQGQQQLLLL